MSKRQRRKPLLVSLPDALDFGFVTVQVPYQHSFTVQNPNDFPVSYRFKCDRFKAFPQSSQIAPRAKIDHIITYVAQQAIVQVGTLIMETEQEDPRIFKFSVIVKWVYLSLSTDKLNFERILVGKSSTKEIIIKNNSLVNASFRLQRIYNDAFKDNSFSPSVFQGVIPPKKTFLIKITYSPSLVKLISTARFLLNCDGGNSCHFDCVGQASGFQVRLSNRSINFGQIKINQQTSRLLTVHNEQDLPTSFQFAYMDNSGVFSFSESRGFVPAKSYKRITVNFKPQSTICYFQRVFCQVNNNNELLFIDLMGTCYDLLIEPIPIVQYHIDSFRKRVAEGRISQIDLKYIQNSLLLKMQNAKKNDIQKLQETSQPPILTPVEKQVALYKQCFQDMRSRERLVYIQEDLINFGYCQPMTLSAGQQITISNNLNCKLNVFWVVPKKEEILGQALSVFQIFPESATLKPLSQAKFTATFRPVRNSNYFFQQIHFFAIKFNSKLTKQMIKDFQRKQHKLVNQISITKNIKLSQTLTQKVTDQICSSQMIPPVSACLTMVGHSFGPNSLPFIPIVEIMPSQKVTFLPCSPNQSVYQTIQIINKTDTHTYFNIIGDAHQIFRAFPTRGLIESKSFALLHLQFNPKEPKLYNSSLLVQLNFSQGSQKIHLVGYCSEPQLSFQNEGKLYFPPTHMGVLSRQTLKVKNTSRIAVSCQTKIPQKYKDELYSQPAFKILQPLETAFFQISFVPYHKKQYKIKMPFVVEEVVQKQQELTGFWKPGSIQFQTPPVSRKQYNIQIVGAGGDGCLVLQPQQIVFDVVKVSEHKKMTVKLKNQSDACFYVQLSLFPKKHIPGINAKIQKSFSLDFNQGLIAAHSQLLIGIMFTPIQVCSYDLDLVVSSKQKNIKLPKKKIIRQSAFKCSLSIKANGSYPILKIVDIRNDSVSVAALWQNFQISKINKQLKQPLNQQEKKYLNIETLPFQQAQELQSKLKSFSWNYGYVPSKNMKARKIIITVQNNGGTSLDYSFKFPSDNKIQQETWADPGQPNQQQAYEKAILSKNIFQIKPRSDSLQPGAIRDIQLIYTPANISRQDNMWKKKKDSNNQKHHLKVVFQINNGKPMVINLIGMTLGSSQGLVVVKKNHYTLTPAPIGLLVPIKFPIEIQNVGSGKINFQVKIKQYQSEKHVNVFSIKNSSGSLPPGQKQYLYCMFKPLQAKRYLFQLQINVFDFVKQSQEVSLTVEGQGYHRMGKVLQKIQGPSQNQIPGQRSLVSQIGSKVFFSIQEIDFGILLANQTTHRMIILYNLSKTSGFFFQFNSSLNNKNGLACGDLFQIQPSSGQIQSEKWMQLKLSLSALKSPSIYEGQIQCLISWGKKEEDKEKQKMGQSNSVAYQKQTLFLRIKKSCSLEINQINQKRDPEFRYFVGDQKKSLIDSLRNNLVLQLINQSSNVVNIKKQSSGSLKLISDLDQQQTNVELPSSKRNFRKHKYLFMNEQFLDLVQMIMENTFFNIIQETTRKENDLLRIPRRFISVNR